MTNATRVPAIVDADRRAAVLGPVQAEALANPNHRVCPGDARRGDHTATAVVDLHVHGASIAPRWRCLGLHPHTNTNDTAGRVIAFELNGAGETRARTRASTTTGESDETR